MTSHVETPLANTQSARLSVPVPPRMANLPKDSRGYPTPANVYLDASGKPHFTVNDEKIRQRFIAEDKCPICAQRLLRGRWFVGGPRSAFDPKGQYIDTAMHYECLEYALKVCPYLAAPNYSKRIDSKTVPEGEQGQIFQDPTMIPDRPQTFVAIMATATDLTVHPVIGHVMYVKPRGPYKIVEFWRKGARISGAEGFEIAMQSGVSGNDIAAKIDKKTLVRWGD